MYQTPINHWHYTFAEDFRTGRRVLTSGPFHTEAEAREDLPRVKDVIREKFAHECVHATGLARIEVSADKVPPSAHSLTCREEDK